MLAPEVSVRSVVTNSEAVLGGTDEGRPLVLLNTVRVNETTDGVTVAIRTMRIQFTSLIAGCDVHRGEVSCTGDLRIVRCDEVVGAVNGAVGNRTRAVTGSGAPRYFNALRVTDRLSGSRRSPETEVVDIVDIGSLASRGLTVGRTAIIVTRLTWLRLVRLRVDGETSERRNNEGCCCDEESRDHGWRMKGNVP